MEWFFCSVQLIESTRVQSKVLITTDTCVYYLSYKNTVIRFPHASRDVVVVLHNQ